MILCIGSSCVMLPSEAIVSSILAAVNKARVRMILNVTGALNLRRCRINTTWSDRKRYRISILWTPNSPCLLRCGSACRCGVRNGLGLSSYGSFHEYPLHKPPAPLSTQQRREDPGVPSVALPLYPTHYPLGLSR